MRPATVIALLIGIIIGMVPAVIVKYNDDNREAEAECIARAIASGVERRDIIVEDGRCYL